MIIAQFLNDDVTLSNVDDLNLDGLKGAIISVNSLSFNVNKSDNDSVSKSKTLSSDVIGVIEKIDSETEFKIGDRVVIPSHMPCLNCTYCKQGEYSKCSQYQEVKLFPTAFSQQVFVSEEQLKLASKKIPNEIADVKMSVYSVLASCINDLENSNTRNSGTALILGLDIKGLLIAELLKSKNYKLFGGDLSESRNAAANSRNIETYSISNPEMFISTIKHKTQDAGVDVVYLSSDADNSIDIALDVVKQGGKIIILSTTTKSNSININKIYQKELKILANNIPTSESFNKAFQLIASKRISITGLIKTYGFNNIKQAQSDLLNGNAYRAFLTIGKKIDIESDLLLPKNIDNKVEPKKPKEENIVLGQRIMVYDVNDTENKHKCLEIDEEFEEKSKEIYDIKNSKFCLPMKTDDLIQSCIYNTKNYWDAGLLAKADKILKDEAVILDIGANIGNHTLYWAKERNAKKIYSFEPYPYSYRILQKNVEINDLENIVTTCPFGISDKEAKGSVVTFCPTNIGGLKFENDVNGDFDFKPLDSLNIKEKIDLIKIDVEGAELEVLNGGIETIKRNRPIIIIETFDKKETIEKLLYSIGYEFYDDNRAMCDYIYYCREKKYMSVLKSFIKRCTFH